MPLELMCNNYAELGFSFLGSKENFEKVVQLKPDYAYAYYALGLAFEKEDNIEKAIENYEKFTQNTDDKNLKNNIQNKISNLSKKLPKEEKAENQE